MAAPICACITPWGSGAVSVVRVSGDGCADVVRAVSGPLPAPRAARLARLRDAAGPFDEGLVLWMPGPHSYTGEDVAEISCHGNPLLVERLLAALQAAGARLAAPGEFTRRAFLHGRLDLTRAEAVLQTLEARSPAGLALASAARAGAVAAAGEALRQPLLDIGAELEAILDYPGEDLLFDSDASLIARLRAVEASAAALVRTHAAGRMAVEGATVALVGPVNAGKSSLFNALLGRTRALVSATPGTTRDVVESRLALPGVSVTLLDTAGEREDPEAIEAEGLALGRVLVADADLVLVVASLAAPSPPPVAALVAQVQARGGRVLRVGTHLDVAGGEAACGGAGRAGADRVDADRVDVAVSSQTGEGVEALKAAIARALVGEELPSGERVVLASARQRDCFGEVARGAAAAALALEEGAGPAVAAEAVYDALGALDALEGRDSREAVMDRLFSRFCVGK